MDNFRTMFVVGALIVTGAFVAWPRAATADRPAAAAAAAAAAPSCQQWEVMLSPSSVAVVNANALPEMGKPFVEKAPAGWEPFGFKPTGQLVYRRCTK